MRRLIHVTIDLVSALLFGLFAIAVSAQESVDPAVQNASSELQRLVDDAEEITLNGAQDADGRAAIIARWRMVQDRAAMIPLPSGDENPFVHLASIKIASQLYASGENASAQAELAPALEGIEPHRTQFLATFGEGVALLGVLMAHGGEGEAAMPIVRKGFDRFVESYVTLDPGERNRGLVIAKSNLEFSLSQVALRIGDNDGALDFQRASLTTREAALGPDHPDTIAAYYGYAGTLRRAGRMAEAESFARTAVERAVGAIDTSHPSYARSLEMLGIVLSRSGRPLEATQHLLRALQLKREHEGADNLVFGYGIHNLATIFLQRERYADASPLFVEAEALFRSKQGAKSPFAIGSLAYAGQIDFVEGRYEDAVRRLSQLDERLGSDTSDLEIAARIAPDLVAALIEVGNFDAARERTEDLYRLLLSTDVGTDFEVRRAALLRARIGAIGSMENVSAATSEAESMVSYLRRQRYADRRWFLQSEQRAALDMVMDLAAKSQDSELMLSAMALIAGSDIARASSLRDKRSTDTESALASAIRSLQDADEKLDAADRALLAALAENKGIPAKHSALAAARSERAEALESLERDFPEWSDRSRELDSSLADIQNSLAPNVGLVAVIPAYNGAYVLAVTQTGTVVERLSLDRAELLRLAKRLRGSLDARQFDEMAATSLGTAVFPDTVRALLKDRDEIRVLAGGSLASLPFSLLRWSAKEDIFLIDRFAISNVATLPGNYGQEPESDRHLGRLVAFADPQYGGGEDSTPIGIRDNTTGISDYFGREAPDFSQLSRLAALPRTAAEANSLASMFEPGSATLYLGAEATEQAINEDNVSQADVLLFATHGLVAGEIEGIAEPSLVLTLNGGESGSGDGLLTASEIEQLRLSADWVILSACDSAAGMDAGLPAFSGLARAFRFAGAKDLLVSHWQVRDDVAAFVSAETLRKYSQGGSKAAALRSAILKLRNDSDLPGRGRPEIWAPFALIQG